MSGTRPNSGTSKDGRKKENPGAKPGPKLGSRNGEPSRAKPDNRRGKRAK